MTLRATTNLVVPKDLQLPRKELKSRFLYVYGKGYTGLEPVFINKLWLSSVFPAIAADPTYGKDRRGVRAWASVKAKTTHAGYLRLTKVTGADPHFVAAIPLAEFNRHEAGAAAMRYRNWFTTFKTGEEATGSADGIAVQELNEILKAEVDAPTVRQHVIPGRSAIEAIPGLDPKAKAELLQTLLSIRVTFKGSICVVFADFRIDADIAQQLTTTPWIELRAIDLYPLLLNWVAGQFGYTVDAPLAAFPVSKIARTLPPVQEGQARVDANGISISPDGTPYWLPAKLDNTQRYEDLYSQVGAQDDGSFGLLDMDAAAAMVMRGEELKTKLPANIPVLIDWINNKYAYTLSTGMLKIQDLSRFKAADAAHARNILGRVFDEKLFAQIVNMATSSGVSDVVKLTTVEIDSIHEKDPVKAERLSHPGGYQILEYYGLAEQYFLTFGENAGSEVLLRDVSSKGDPSMRPIGRYMEAAHQAILNNLEAVNARYAVSSVSFILGVVTLLAKYASDFGKVTLEANKLCGAALNQGVDPSWTPPSIPLLSDKIGFLPHQKKVRNLLKDSPNFAILPIMAGGGKSPLTITDVLYEIKGNRNAPYLILCPSHLVAQYVKEIVYFTSGKLNAVPINTYTIFRNGFDRLTKLLAGAPRNTVVVCDYDALRGRQEQVCYGTTSVTVYPVIEFLRQFNFGYVMCDEAHMLKNDSQRTRATMALIADIPKIRLASGTMAHDSPSDLALQIATLDPTLFGTRDQFNERFGDTVSGGRVIKWKPGAQSAIMKIIRSRVVVAGAQRKEWAALLPRAEELFHGVELSPAQMQVYQAILTETLERMEEDAKTNKTLQKFFNKGLAQPVEGEGQADEQEDAADENAGADLESLLGFYLARLEQFTTAPARDELGNKVLQGDDRLSPKVRKIIERIRVHLDANTPGKVLIFTNYTESAEEIFEALPPDLKAQALLYVAADKVETGAAFEGDDTKKIMIGVENSMNTGLNLQHVSRLIRVETVWNPGTLEQGNSRVNRPELKKADRRDKIYYDWIVANRTVDITKVSRLISKVIAVAKFENADDLAYESIPDVDIIPMNAESIQGMNDWNESLSDYLEAYKEYKSVQHADYEEYRRVHGELKLDPIQVAPVPPDAKLMRDVPYTPGLELYKAGELGLVRLDEFLRQDSSAGEDGDEGEDEGAAEGAKQQKIREIMQGVVGQAVHTEYGDGIIKSIMLKSRKVDVVLPSGYLVRVALSAAFVITRPSTSTKDIRNQILKSIGEMPLTEPLDVPGATFRRDNVGLRKAEKERERQEQEKSRKTKDKLASISVELQFSVSNGFLGVTYFVDEKHPEATNALQALGFRPTPKFAYAEIKRAQQLVKQFNVWEDEGFTLDKSMGGIAAAFQDLFKLLKSGKIMSHVMSFKYSTANQLKNFYRQEVKPSTSKHEIKPYPMVEDGAAYIVLPLRGQPASTQAIKFKAPGVRWQMSPDSLTYFALDTAAAGRVIKDVLEAGIQIANIEDLKSDFKHLRKVKVRDDDQGFKL